jgi:N-dimethylarginine dimethylaminohydrolase
MAIDRLLLCPPTYYDIEYSINPWMNIRNKVDHANAERQWLALCERLAALGVRLEFIDPVPGLPDMTFAGDCGIVRGNEFILSNFKHPERQGEAAYYLRWLEGHGYKTHVLAPHLVFEGLGDVVYFDDDVFLGYGVRSSEAAIAEVQTIFPDLRVAGRLNLADPAFFHLALAIAYIAKDTVLYYPDAFDLPSREVIRANTRKAYAVSECDAKEFFVCNNIVIGETILMDDCTDLLGRELAEDGFEVIKCDMSEFKKSGGSLRCLVLKL